MHFCHNCPDHKVHFSNDILAQQSLQVFQEKIAFIVTGDKLLVFWLVSSNDVIPVFILTIFLRLKPKFQGNACLCCLGILWQVQGNCQKWRTTSMYLYLHLPKPDVITSQHSNSTVVFGFLNTVLSLFFHRLLLYSALNWYENF